MPFDRHTVLVPAVTVAGAAGADHGERVAPPVVVVVVVVAEGGDVACMPACVVNANAPALEIGYCVVAAAAAAAWCAAPNCFLLLLEQVLPSTGLDVARDGYRISISVNLKGEWQVGRRACFNGCVSLLEEAWSSVCGNHFQLFHEHHTVLCVERVCLVCVCVHRIVVCRSIGRVTGTCTVIARWCHRIRLH